MRQRLHTLENWLPAPDRRAVWVGLALLMKGALFVMLLPETNRVIDNPDLWPYWTWDSRSYIDPLENLYLTGQYAPDYRMPGFAPLYLPLRALLSQTGALNALSLVHLAFETLSVYWLALAVWRFSGRRAALFYVCFFAYGASAYVSTQTPRLMAECMATSLLIGWAYALASFKDEKRLIYALLAGSALTWAVFFKPVYLPFYGLTLAFLLWEGRKTNGVRAALLALLPWLVADGAWVARNYLRHDKVFIISQTTYYPHIEHGYAKGLWRYIQSWGGNVAFWYGGAEIRWFRPGRYNHPGETPEPPARAFCESVTLDSARLLRARVHRLLLGRGDGSLDSLEALRLTEQIREQGFRYAAAIRRERPFTYWVTARLQLFRRFYGYLGVYNVFPEANAELSLWKLGLKAFWAVLYLFSVYGGFAGSAFALWRLLARGDPFGWLGMAALYGALIYPVVLRHVEYRYFVPAYPFMLACGCYLAVWASGKALSLRYGKSETSS